MDFKTFSPDDRFYLGVDPGQSVDPTGIAIVREVDRVFQVGHLARLPLGTPYPGVVWHVKSLLGHPILRNRTEVVLDETGVGKAVRDLFADQGVDPVAVAITAGIDEAVIEARPLLPHPQIAFGIEAAGAAARRPVAHSAGIARDAGAGRRAGELPGLGERFRPLEIWRQVRQA
jgi:hypothetical protein